MKYSHAFSILELLIALAIIAIMTSIAIMPLFTIIAKNKAVAGSNQIIAALQLTRSEAITRNQQVIFCKSKDYKTCGGDWSDGQIIVTNNNELIRVLYSQADSWLSWKSSLGKDDAVTYLPTGTTKGQQGTFYYCPKQNKTEGVAIILEQTGRIRTTPYTCK